MMTRCLVKWRLWVNDKYWDKVLSGPKKKRASSNHTGPTQEAGFPAACELSGSALSTSPAVSWVTDRKWLLTDANFYVVSRCHGSVEMPPWWRWSRRSVFCVERSKLVSGLRRICASRTACPSCPAGRGSSRRHTLPHPPPLLPDRPPQCSGTRPSEIHRNDGNNKGDDDAAIRPRPAYKHLIHVKKIFFDFQSNSKMNRAVVTATSLMNSRLSELL